MNQHEAVALAAKREAHKSKHMTNKEWRAVHDSVTGWHAALVDRYAHIAATQREKARRAFIAGNTTEFLEAASAALLAGVRSELATSETEA